MSKISIVTTLYRSGRYIEEFVKRSIDAVKSTGVDYEIILVNDCCPHNSLEVALEVYEKYDNIKIIDLAANAKHHRAIMTGLENISGDYVFLIDVDLEESPELVVDFYNKIKNSEEKLDLVYGLQKKRLGGLARGLLSNIFHRVFSYLTGNKLHGKSKISIMTKRFVKNLTRFKEYDIFLPGIVSLNGFKSDYVEFEKPHTGQSSYNIFKRLRLAITAITSFSSVPLSIISVLGILMSFSSFLMIAWILFKKIFFGSVINGWSSLMLSIWFVGGVVILCLGIVAIYLSKIFIEIKARPYSIIRDKYGFDD